MAKRRSFAVIGLGTFGTMVASELARFGDHVMGVDTNEARVRAVAEQLSEAVIADARDEQALREAGLSNYDVALIAIGEDLEANIVCAMNVKLLGVKTVWAKALSRTHHRILTRIGVDRVILPEQEIGQHIAQMLHNPEVQDYMSLGNAFHVVSFNVPPSMAGRTLGSLKVAERFDLRCLGLMRANDFVVCDDPGVTLAEDDRLLLLGRRQSFRKFGDSM